MKVLELFAGTGSMGKAFRDRGHEVFSVDLNPKFKVDMTKDVMELRIEDVPFKPDVIWASPPCPCFSVAAMGSNWDSMGRPKTVGAIRSIGNVLATLDIIKQFKPKYYFIENPVGLLRKMSFMQSHARITADYCQYGSKARKPTDIFTNIATWKPKRCHNGATCHEASPRGSKSGGIQGMKDNTERAIIPDQLCQEIVRICEEGYKTDEQMQIVTIT